MTGINMNKPGSSTQLTGFRIMIFVMVGILLLVCSIGGLDLFHNAPLHTFWGQVFMVNVTFMGDAWFALALTAWMCYKRDRTWKILLLSSLICMGLVQLTHCLVGDGKYDLYVEQGQYLYFTDIKEHLANPGVISSHTALAFVIGASLAGRARNIYQAGFYAILVVLVVLSRLYLSAQGWQAIGAGVIAGFLASLSGVLLYSISRGGKMLDGHTWKISKMDNGQLPDPVLGV